MRDKRHFERELAVPGPDPDRHPAAVATTVSLVDLSGPYDSHFSPSVFTNRQVYCVRLRFC